MYASLSGGTWTIEPADQTADEDHGKYSSLALGSDGSAHMSCQNATSADLEYASGPGGLVSVDHPMPPSRPTELQVFPNPSRGGTVQIQLGTSLVGHASAVEIIDVRGSRVKRLPVDGAGRAVWDGRDESGKLARAGVHFVLPVGGGAAARTRSAAGRRPVVRSRPDEFLHPAGRSNRHYDGRARGTDCPLEAPRATSRVRWVTRPGRPATIEGTEASFGMTSSRRLACGTPRRCRDVALSPGQEAQG